MKLFLIRYTKSTFVYLRLHVIFNLFSRLFLNLFYLTRFSLWASKNKKVAYNDFPGKWDYSKRYAFYKWIIGHESLSNIAINYLEFGVADGHSFRWFVQQNAHPESRFYGFDTFTGLPEDFGVYKKGVFNTNNQVPQINDSRVKFYQGLFQQTLPGFLSKWNHQQRNIVMMDADLYSATLYALTRIAPFLKKGDIIFFDEFAVPTHEFKALYDFQQAYLMDFELIGAANNYYFTAFRII
ncbi:class I SAM-dependent methyltransferase [Ilyomonas limi]|uniref:Class I SAM-dependent methyltransferase n=1 Tax=Ilyomonas limi TaxID=2575867 RepID=A0A4U3L1C3_9BACT|nr:class I SAM-dependent methyltransferase [Ilyomonas limi]TKK68931.1 class I SAM-dependent methyltransferase [Ilyomonas limi]